MSFNSNTHQRYLDLSKTTIFSFMARCYYIVDVIKMCWRYQSFFDTLITFVLIWFVYVPDFISSALALKEIEGESLNQSLQSYKSSQISLFIGLGQKHHAKVFRLSILWKVLSFLPIKKIFTWKIKWFLTKSAIFKTFPPS